MIEKKLYTFDDPKETETLIYRISSINHHGCLFENRHWTGADFIEKDAYFKIGRKGNEKVLTLNK